MMEDRNQSDPAKPRLRHPHRQCGYESPSTHSRRRQLELHPREVCPPASRRSDKPHLPGRPGPCSADPRRTSNLRTWRLKLASPPRVSLTSAAMKIVVAYSGGLDTSVLLTWLKETYWRRGHRLLRRRGPGRRPSTGSRRRPSPPGPANASSATCGRSSLATSSSPCSRPTRSTRAATSSAPPSHAPASPRACSISPRQEGADAIAHGATGKGNDQVRFELSAASLAPQTRVHRPLAPGQRFREQFPGRTEMIAYAEATTDPGQGLHEEALLDGPQPPPHLVRGRDARGSLVRRHHRGGPRDVCPLRLSRGGPRRPAIHPAPFREGKRHRLPVRRPGRAPRPNSPTWWSRATATATPSSLPTG